MTQPDPEAGPLTIDRIYFLIHPCCWAMHTDGIPKDYLETTGQPASNWYSAVNWERAVNRQQMRFISDMKPNEALVIYPIAQSRPMLDLIEQGERCLGRRCIVQKAQVVVEPKPLHDMAEPIRHFLEDEQLDGREAFLGALPERLRDKLFDEVRATCEVSGYDWNPGGLKVISGNLLYADEIGDELAKRKLIVDPATLRAEAFGEGFEQCAMTWKSLIPEYLGWANPIENNFDLSVSGAAVLFDARLVDRIALDDTVRLFLWEKSHGLPMAMFAQAACRFRDPQLYVHVPLDGLVPEVWDVTNKKCWPADDSPLAVEDGCLKVPVMTGLRKGTDGTYYLVGANLDREQFRELLLRARIS